MSWHLRPLIFFLLLHARHARRLSAARRRHRKSTRYRIRQRGKDYDEQFYTARTKETRLGAGIQLHEVRGGIHGPSPGTWQRIKKGIQCLPEMRRPRDSATDSKVVAG